MSDPQQQYEDSFYVRPRRSLVGPVLAVLVVIAIVAVVVFGAV